MVREGEGGDLKNIAPRGFAAKVESSRDKDNGLVWECVNIYRCMVDNDISRRRRSEGIN